MGQLSWDVTDTLTIWVKYERYESDETPAAGIGIPGALISPYNTEARTQQDITLSAQYQWDKPNPTVNDPYTVDFNDTPRVKNDNNNDFTAHVTWDLENLTVRYIGSYSENDWTNENGDVDYTSNPDISIVVSGGQFSEKQTHELQLISASDSALQWIAGLYYYDEELEQPYSIIGPEDEFMETIAQFPSKDPATGFANPDRLYYHQYGELDAESKAAYADVNYSFNEEWKLTVGIRYSEDEKIGYEKQFIYADPRAFQESYMPPGGNCCGWLIAPEREANHKDDWSNTSGRVVLDWTPGDDTLVYASISTGYKSGGFRLGVLQEDSSFDPEEILAYEIGYKATFADVFRFNAAMYYYDYEDMQVNTTFISDTGQTLSQIVNVEAAEVKGFEFESTWLATEALSFMANYSYTDGEYTDFCCAIDQFRAPELGEQDLSGNPLTQTPKNKVSINGNYYWATESMGDFSLTGMYSWVDERQYSIFNRDENLAESYYRVDALVTWTSPSQNIRIIASGKNLSEEETWTGLSSVQNGQTLGTALAPRTYGLEVQYDF